MLRPYFSLALLAAFFFCAVNGSFERHHRHAQKAHETGFQHVSVFTLTHFGYQMSPIFELDVKMKSIGSETPGKQVISLVKTQFFEG